MLDVVAAVEATAAFQEGAAPEAAPGGGSGHAATAAAAQGKGQTGGSGGSPRRHITLEYEGGPGGAPTAAAPAAAPAAATLPSAGGSVVSGGSGRGQAGKQGGEEEEFTPQELLSLEWLRDAPDDVARNYLMNIDGGWRQGSLRALALPLVVQHTPTLLPPHSPPNQAWAASRWAASCCSRWARRSSRWTQTWAASAHGGWGPPPRAAGPGPCAGGPAPPPPARRRGGRRGGGLACAKTAACEAPSLNSATRRPAPVLPSCRLGWIPLDAEGSVEDLDDYAPEPEVHAYLHSR